MRRILFLAYHFPPIRRRGVQRAARFTRLLPITLRAGLRHRPRPRSKSVGARGQDPSRRDPHGDRSAPGTRSRAAAADRPADARPSLARRSRAVHLWWVEGLKALGSKLAPTTDLIYTWMQPYESAAAAADLARTSGKPWVADLGDPWALDEMMVFPTAAHRRRELGRMRKLLRTASAVVMSTPEAAARLRSAFPEMRDVPVISIPNGFDPHDFEGDAPHRSDRAFRIVHTGYLHTQLGEETRRASRLRHSWAEASQALTSTPIARLPP